MHLRWYPRQKILRNSVVRLFQSFYSYITVRKSHIQPYSLYVLTLTLVYNILIGIVGYFAQLYVCRRIGCTCSIRRAALQRTLNCTLLYVVSKLPVQIALKASKLLLNYELNKRLLVWFLSVSLLFRRVSVVQKIQNRPEVLRWKLEIRTSFVFFPFFWWIGPMLKIHFLPQDKQKSICTVQRAKCNIKQALLSLEMWVDRWFN